MPSDQLTRQALYDRVWSEPISRIAASFNLSASGAALLRPDGFVAWRTDTLPTRPDSELGQVLATILCRSTPRSARKRTAD